MRNGKMSYFFAILTLISLVATFHGTGYASQASVREGYYLRVEYIEALKKTLSHSVALEKCGISQFGINVTKKGKILEAMPFSCNEGDEAFRIGIDGIITDGRGRRTNKLKIIDGNTLYLSTTNDQAGNYKYVGDFNKYLADLLINGKYVDENGKTYEFRSDGVCTMDKKKHVFKVSDGCFPKGHIILDDSKPFRAEFGFDIKGEKLELYHVIDNEDDMFDSDATYEDSPFLVLSKVK